MNRTDERKQVERSGHVAHERDDREDQEEEHGEDASMARSPAAARKAEAREMKEEHEEEGHERHDEVKGGREIMHESVEADHVMGEGGRIGTKSAEGMPDMASSKANRKEAEEPEREANEKAAMGGGRDREPSVPTKNTIGWGERETIARHTI